MATATLRVFSAGDWLPVAPELQNLDGLGVGTTSDATNRLAVASAATLLTHAGTDHRLTVNKASAPDTASLLFQSGWSGRAEMGLTGGEDFHVRVSPDGSAWTSALRIDRTSGAAVARSLMSGTIDLDKDTVGTIPTPSAGGMVVINLVDPLYPQAPHSGIFAFDTGPSPVPAHAGHRQPDDEPERRDADRHHRHRRLFLAGIGRGRTASGKPLRRGRAATPGPS